jgi:CDP-diacylglycerol--serine O-phosphatidyltransferase
MLGRLNPPTLMTMAGLICALVACWLAQRGQPELALVGLMAAGLCDLFDGLVARLCRPDAQAREFGVQIDSLVDVVSFGLTPVLIAMAFGLDGPLGLVVGALYLCAAAQRLAHFNVSVQSQPGPVRHYTGLPVTFMALILPLVLALATLLPGRFFHWMLALCLLVVGVLFVAPVRVRKPSGLVYGVMPVLALALSYFWVMRFHG